MRTPMVPAVRPIDLQSGPPIDHHVLDSGALGHGDIGVDFEGKGLAPPVAAVGRDQHLGPAIQDPASQGLGTEPAEDHHVRCADPRAGQDGDHHLRDHRQVDRDDVSLLDPQALEDVGKFRDVAQQVLISQDPALARLTFPDQGGPVFAWSRAMPVDAVERSIELASEKPLGERLVPLQHLVPRFEPGEQLRLLSPEPFGVVLGPVPEGLILLQAADVGRLGELGRGRKDPSLPENTVDRSVALRSHVRTLPVWNRGDSELKSSGQPPPVPRTPPRDVFGRWVGTDTESTATGS